MVTKTKQERRAESLSATVAEVEQRLKIWKREARKQGLVCLRSLILIVTALTLGAIYLAPKAWPILLAGGVGVGLLILATASAEPRNVRRLTPDQQQVLDSLDSLEDESAIDLLILELTHTSADTLLYEALTSALTRLLERLNPNEVPARITQCAALYSRLNIYTATVSPDLVSAILRLLPTIPSQEALTRAAYLIAHDAPIPARQRVRRAAQTCFEGLLQAVDFGSPTAQTLQHWARELSGIISPRITWEAYILPQLAIQQLLPRMTVSEFLEMDAYDRQRLYRSLTWHVHYTDIGASVESSRLGSGYGLALLDFALQAHDLEALPTVRILAHHDLDVSEAVREVAKECLPAFEAIARQEAIGRTLLRAGRAPEVESGLLLRTANGISEVDSQQLLRVSDRE